MRHRAWDAGRLGGDANLPGRGPCARGSAGRSLPVRGNNAGRMTRAAAGEGEFMQLLVQVDRLSALRLLVGPLLGGFTEGDSSA